MDCNAIFSEIFTLRTFQHLHDIEKSVMMSSFNLFSQCNDCDIELSSQSLVFVHYITQKDIIKFQLLPSLWPELLVANNINNSMPCSQCNKTWPCTNNTLSFSNVLLVEFESIVFNSINFQQSVTVHCRTYKLQALVHNSSMPFSCAIENGGSWLYLNDLDNCVRIYLALETLYEGTPPGWFFGVYILSSEVEPFLRNIVSQDNRDVIDNPITTALLRNISASLPIQLVNNKDGICLKSRSSLAQNSCEKKRDEWDLC